MALTKPEKLFGAARLAIVTATTGIAVSAAPSLAQEQLEASPPAGISFEQIGPLVESLRRGSVREQYISQVVAPLRSADQDGDGLDKHDLERNEIVAKAGARAREIEALLRNDFNGDYKVTSEEIVKYSNRKNLETAKRRAEQMIKRLDRDGDGIVTLNEASTRAEPRHRFRYEQSASLLALDPNGDGRITAIELVNLAEKTFDHFDKNGDRTIGADEYAILKVTKDLAKEKARLRKAGCVFPVASERAQLVFVGAGWGRKTSTAYIGAQREHTSIIDVEIERGKRPLHLMLVSVRPVIWRFSGATQRINHAVLSSNRSVNQPPKDQIVESLTSAAGAIGLPKEKISVVGPTCLPNIHRNTRPSRAELVGQVIAGRSFDVISSVKNYVHIALPSGSSSSEHEATPLGPTSPPFQSARWKSPYPEIYSHLVKIDPRVIVAVEPVGNYSVLPEHYGIAQWVEDGTLVPDDQSRLRVTKDIARWPAGLRGGYSVTFIVGEGIKIPEGQAGHSCILTEKEAAQKKWKQVCFDKSRPSSAVSMPAPPPPPPSPRR